MWTYYEFFSTIDLLHFVFRSPIDQHKVQGTRKNTAMVELQIFPIPKQKVYSLTKPYYCID